MKLNILNTVSKVPEQTERKVLGAGLYFVRNDEQTGLYIVTPFSINVHKIFDTLDYKTKVETDEELGNKANQTQVNDIAASVDVLAVTKAEKSVVDALQNGIIRQIAVSTYNTGNNSLSSVYGLTANSNGSNGKAKQNGWDVLVIADETKGGKSNRYNWNGTEWVDMLSGVYDENAQLVTYRKWLRDKTANYTKTEIGAISRIFNITIFADANHLDTDVYSLNECYVKDGFGVISIFKNGKSYFRRSEIELSKQRYTDHRVDVIYDYSIPASGNLNTTNDKIIISPSSIVVPPSISESNVVMLRSKKWLKNKEIAYDTASLTAINRILDIKIYVRNIVNTDVYTLNILKKKTENIYDLQIFRNGTFLYNIDLDASKDYAERKAIIEVNYNLSVEGSDLNALESQIVISPTCLVTLEDYFLSRTYQMIDIERNNVGNVVSASVKWNDGVMGVYTATDYNKKWMCYDGYTVSYDASAKYIRQQKVTRNNIGAIIKQPAIDIV